MKAKLTSKGQITIPLKIRRKLRLKAGQELDFDESTPYLKATRVIDEKAMRSVAGCLKEQIRDSIPDILDRTRGKVDLP